MKPNLLKPLVATLAVVLSAAALAAPTSYHLRQYVPGLTAIGSGDATPAAPTAPSMVGDGVSKAGACASGAATGCASWDSTGKPTSIAIEADFLSINTSGTGAARGAVGKVDGKWYWEVQLLAPSDSLLVGTGTATLSLVNPFTATPPMWSWYSNKNPGNAKICSAWLGGSTVATTGDIVGVALDMPSHSVTFYKNGSPVVTCANVTASEAVFPVLGSGGNPVSVRANFGQNNFQHPVPTGFNAGLW